MANATRAITPERQTSGPLMRLTAAPINRNLQDVHKAARDANSTQTYIDRVRNYIPLEVIAFFIFCNAMIDNGEAPQLLWSGSASPDDFVAVATVLVSLVGVVIYVKTAAERADTGTWKLHAVVSCLAFLVWAYAIGAEALPVLGIPQVPSVSGLLLGTFTLFSGLVVPVRKDDAAGAGGEGAAD
ncbi:hypothetical protein [Tropicibacter oceani]|uniref:Uncharacterized protein n=1 Tax=Tropicibacter oceani TaxID=3058420 RepID=A0ABY8QLS9_9RHOB|nr:hypothetical protein [Tropicibacter oceani]WGW05514.1 hypothetical protein QF118_08195 [Tropicibacter oceani]